MKHSFYLLAITAILTALTSCAATHEAAKTTNDAATIARSAWDVRHIWENW